MIQYIRIETDDSGEIIGVGLGDPCIDCSSAYEAVKKVLSETSGLPQDASTNEHISTIREELSRPYLLAKQKLAAESGLADFCTVEEHLAVIKAKAQREGAAHNRDLLLHILSEHSGLVPSNEVGDHIAAIKLKAYDQGFDTGWHGKKADIQKRIKQEIRVRDEVYSQSYDMRFVVTKIWFPFEGEDSCVNGLKKDGTAIRGLLLCNLKKTGLHVDDLDSYLEV